MPCAPPVLLLSHASWCEAQAFLYGEVEQPREIEGTEKAASSHKGRVEGCRSWDEHPRTDKNGV
jgi:hypothetical protein